MQDYNTKVAEIKYLTPKTIELEVELIEPDKVEFSAGQFMQFKIGPNFRSYSITSIPDHNTKLKFCVGLLEQGVGTNFTRGLKVGDEVLMRGPSGIFTLNKFDRDILFVATGVGIAPFVSVIPDALNRGFGLSAQLLFGLRHEQDRFFYDHFRGLAKRHKNFKFTPILSRPEAAWPGFTGRVTNYLDEHYNAYKGHMFYICGGMGMIKDVRHLLMGKGHPLKDIKLEIFT